MSRFITRILFLLFAAMSAGNLLAAECEHVFSNNWGSGFQAEIQITNTGTTPISSFSVTWSYSDNTTVTNVWNADSTGTNPVTATSPVWFSGLAPGATYSIGMNASGAGAGATVTGDVCDSGSPKTAELQLAKTWVNGVAGDEITATTTGLVNNATISSISTGSNSDTGLPVLVTVGEGATLPPETFVAGTVSDYTTSDWVCDDAANTVIAAGGTLTIANADAGSTITCTLTNEYVDPNAPSSGSSGVSCEQVMVNNWGSGFQGRIEVTNTSSAPIDNWTTSWGYSDGTTVGSVWNATATGSNPVTAMPPGYFTTLAPGATWNVNFVASGAGNLDNLTCSTELVKAIALTLTKNVVNDHGGTAAATDWILEANLGGGVAELSGVTGVSSSTLVAGIYELTETGPAGYSQRNLECDSGSLAGSTLTLAAGDDVICTFYNDDLPVSLTLIKVVNNSQGTASAGDWTLDASLAGTSMLSGTSGTASVTSAALVAGDYVLSESGGPLAYQLESLSCDAGVLDGTTNTLTLENGDVAICVFTNRDKITDLSIVKSVDNVTPRVGDVINFTLEVSNLGPDPAVNVVVDDPLAAGFTFVAGSMTGGDVQNQTAPNLQWQINYLDVGAAYTQTLQYQVTVNANP